MGAFGDAFVAYAQPLLEGADGSHADVQKAMTLGQFCWNLALLPKDSRDEAIHEIRVAIPMDDAEFAEFRNLVVIPMIERHQEMFPLLHQRSSTGTPRLSPWEPPVPQKTRAAEKYPGADRYGPCPCNSGRKYKFCCGKKDR